VFAAAQPEAGNVLVLSRAEHDAMTTSPLRAGTARQTEQSGFTLIELLIVVAMIAVLATIAFPLMLRARITSNESVAVAALRTIHSAEAAYASVCGSGGYAQSLEDLAKIPPGTSVGFVQEPYTKNGTQQNGYFASVTGGSGATLLLPHDQTCNGSADDAVTTFVAERHAVVLGQTGVRSFAVDTQGTMFMRQDGMTIDNALTGTATFK
jgi:prepilin-type N-terminal cleavage/methylation domain-containing protein